MKYKSMMVIGSLAFSGVSSAAPIDLQLGPVYVQLNNLEQVGNIDTSGFTDLAVGNGSTLTAGSSEFNWGVFNVSTIQAGAVATPNTDISGGTAYFADGFSGGQVHGIFYGLQQTGALTLTGGYMDIYWTDGNGLITAADLNGGFSPTNRTDWNSAGKFTSGTLLARFQFQSGVVSGDNTTTIKSNVDPLAFTGNGQADGYASVVDVNNDGKIDALDGAWAASLNGDWFHVDPNGNAVFGEVGETRDFRFSNFFSNLDTWDSSGLQGLRSNDPARALVVSVPEPVTLALVGVALLAAGLNSRRRT